MKRFSLLLILSLMVNSAFSAPLKLNYSLFFGYMKTLNKQQYKAVTTAFYLQQQGTTVPCLIEKAEMVVDEKREPIKFEKEGRLVPFYSDKHRKDGAMIEVQLVNEQRDLQCDLQVTLMASDAALDNLSLAQLTLISTQLATLLEKNAGMVGKYFLPTFAGIRLQLQEPVSKLSLRELDKHILFAENGDLLIKKESFQQALLDKPLSFKVARITPWLVK